MKKGGGAIVIKEAKVSPESLAKAIEKVLASPDIAQKMAGNALKNGAPEATKKLYEVLVSVIKVETK